MFSFVVPVVRAVSDSGALQTSLAADAAEAGPLAHHKQQVVRLLTEVRLHAISVRAQLTV